MCAVVNEPVAPIVIDVEASGFGRGSYPIEVGFVMPDGSTHCTLIKPEASWVHWDESSEMLHGISRDILAEHGKPVDEVALWLNQHLRGLTAYSDAWGNDLSWLGTLFEYAEVPQLFHLDALNKLLSEEQMNAWADTRNRVVSELNIRRHRASNDAKVIQRTYLATLPVSSGSSDSVWSLNQLMSK
ncbi:hypothetical protein [Alkalimarinus coralli]|uniref:3'-5' exonuclease n=1 Tax=Alkalimarinus coralli TaxID=2935863 RepID=UPI00202B94BE|nr:hypothetical protein [Alkalimarinus coralli]